MHNFATHIAKPSMVSMVSESAVAAELHLHLIHS